jgi:hypothetical protein
MKSLKTMNQAELAAFVQTALRRVDINLVLTGGAAVTFYTSNKYMSRDLDLVDLGFSSFQKIKAEMKGIGFHQKGRHFEHPETPFLVEFVASPLSVGNEPVSAIDEIKLPTGLLKIISPTDCVKDRLAAYFHWDDWQSLDQALLVARSKKISTKEIERWSKAEKMMEKFKVFRNRLKN